MCAWVHGRMARRPLPTHPRRQRGRRAAPQLQPAPRRAACAPLSGAAASRCKSSASPCSRVQTFSLNNCTLPPSAPTPTCSCRRWQGAAWGESGAPCRSGGTPCARACVCVCSAAEGWFDIRVKAGGRGGRVDGGCSCCSSAACTCRRVRKRASEPASEPAILRGAGAKTRQAARLQL